MRFSRLFDKNYFRPEIAKKVHQKLYFCCCDFFYTQKCIKAQARFT